MVVGGRGRGGPRAGIGGLVEGGGEAVEERGEERRGVGDGGTQTCARPTGRFGLHFRIDHTEGGRQGRDSVLRSWGRGNKARGAKVC